MVENPDNTQSAGAAESSSSRGQGNRSRRKDKRNNPAKRSSKFKGKCEDIKECIYEISSSGGDSFTKTNREVAEYVGRAITGAGEFRTAMIDLRMGDELEPVPPDDPNAPDFAIRVEIWREDRKAWARRAENRLKVKQQIFPRLPSRERRLWRAAPAAPPCWATPRLPEARPAGARTLRAGARGPLQWRGATRLRSHLPRPCGERARRALLCVARRRAATRPKQAGRAARAT